MPKKKITYILANIDKALAFEWIITGLQSKYDFTFIFLNEKPSYLYSWLKEQEVECYFLKHGGKKSYFRNWFKVYSLLKNIRPDIVHTHLRDANLLGLTAAKFVGIKKRIYTRHHSSFHHQYFPKAVKWDKLCNRIATDIVAISKNVQNILVKKETVPPKKVWLIHHGFDLEQFQNVASEYISDLSQKYKLTEKDHPVIGVISRYMKLKGIQYIIPAFKKLLVEYPHAKLVLANASGPDKNYIQSLLQKELPKENYIEIPFENNLFALYQLFDIFVHVPINTKIEAFGQIYVEALAAGIPSIFTLSGVAPEFIEDKKNALVVDYKSKEAIYTAMSHILKNPSKTKERIEEGKAAVYPFKLELFIEQLEKLYG